jgi:hypothetical protein
MKNVVFWDMEQCGLLKSDDSEELILAIFRIEIISELATTLAVFQLLLTMFLARIFFCA